MYKPLVSLIIPVYNMEKYLDTCLKSIILSTYKNLEIIIIDDCSIDNSEKIIKKYIQNDKRIIHVKNSKNLNVSESRNKGLKKVSGDYIMFVDSDDYISSNWIKNMVENIERKKCDVVIGASKQFKESNIKDYTIKDLDVEKQVNFKNIRINKNGVIWNKIYRTELMKKNNIKFDKSILKHGDVEFTYKCLALADKIYYINKGFYYYRNDNENSITKTINYEEKIKYTTMLIKNISNFSKNIPIKNTKLLKKLSEDIMEAYLKSDKVYPIEKSLLRKSGLFLPEIEYLKYLRKKIKNNLRGYFL